MSSQLLEEQRRAVDGEVLVSGDGRYDSVRLPWNRTVDPKPAVVVEAAGPEDVRVAVLAARAHGLPFAVQATGHGTVVACDGGLLLSTARTGEVQVDPESRTATAGPGALWSDVIAAAAPHQLAPLSGRANSAGVAGYTLGGGTGWLSRKHGFAADSVLWAEVVTAGGETLTASATEHPDLFWALRGGGGNFGVVTRLRFKLYPVAQVYAGMSWHPADRAAAVLDRYREWAGTEPDELNSAVLVQQVPPLPEVPEPLRGRACWPSVRSTWGRPRGPSGCSGRCWRPPGRRCWTASGRPASRRPARPPPGPAAADGRAGPPGPVQAGARQRPRCHRRGGRRPGVTAGVRRAAALGWRHGPAVAGRPARSAIPTCRSRSPRWPPTTEATSRSGSTRPWTGWSRRCDRAPVAARS